MKRIIYTLLLVALMGSTTMYAGNPDRQGESGAPELLMNPWARSSGFHTLNTACIGGVEAMRLNVAGLSRLLKGEFVASNTQLYSGTGMSLNAIGLATKMGSNGTLGVSMTSLDFGDIPVTTVDQPEGTGADFSPSFFHLGLGYSYMYENKISVGLLVRGISESLQDVSAFGFAIDAGVQYVSGEQDNFRLGISLRNTGSPMTFGGEGLSFAADNPDPSVAGTSYQLTVDQRAASFELPSVLNIGISYDFYVMSDSYIRAVGNFTSNAFSKDQVGVGAEFSYKDMIQLRGGYRADFGSATNIQPDIYTGWAAGASIMVPVKKGSENKVGIDYAYRTTNPFKGTHNISARVSF